MSICGSSAPDTSGINDAARLSADVSREALDWYKQRDAQAQPLRDAAAQKAIEVADQQLTSSKANDALSADYADYNKTTFRPLEQGIVSDAESYDTPAKRQAAAEAAVADVNSGVSAAREASARRLAANGIDPGSARSIAALDGQDVAQASAATAAAYKARQGVETVGHAMKMDAASLGRNLPSAQATSAQVALTAGNNAVGNANVPVTNANQGTATYGAGFNTAIQGANVAGNLYGTAATAGAKDNGLFGMLGNIAGQYVGSNAGSAQLAGLFSSDVNVKKDIEPASDEEALNEIAATPVSKWKYDPAKMAAAGVQPPDDGGVEHTGPMAQDVNAAMGEDAAPGGKAIDLVTMNGKAMGAIRALDKKVNNLAAMIRSGKAKAEARA